MQFCRSEVDEHCIAVPGCAEIAERLRDMFGGQRRAGFQLKDETVFDEQVGEVVTKDSAVFITHLQRFLLLDCQSDCFQSVSHPVFIDLLEMPVAKITVQFEGGLTNPVA